MSTPSIALIPSGYKEGLLYSQLPINGDGDLTFARTTIANRVNEQGVNEEMAVNVPRLDYSDGGCPSLLLEPSSTNLWVGSEGTDATYTTPLGEFGFTNVNGSTYSSNQDVVGKTVSMFFLVKKSDNSAPIIGVSSNPSSDVVVRLAGSSSVSSSFITTDLGNGFYLAEVENYAVVGTNTSSVNIQNSSGVDTFISMVQLEELSYSTSYIETLSGTIETRTADTISKSGLSNYIGQIEGVLYLDIKALANDGTNRIIALGNNFNFDNSLLFRYSSVSNRIIVQSRVNGVYEVQLNYDLTDSTQFSKVAFKYKENEFALWVDGAERDSSNSGLVPNEINSIFQVSANELCARVRDFRVYDSALTDQELTDLTS